MKNLYTVDEIAAVIRELGLDAEILPDEPDRDTRIHSRTNEIAWQIAMTGDRPFHFGIRARVPLWVRGDPLRWANDWNRQRWSQAFAAIDPDTNRPVTSERTYMVGIESTFIFGTGVTPEYIAGFIDWWTEEVNALSEFPEVTFYAELPQ
jgi:hypothetical protein